MIFTALGDLIFKFLYFLFSLIPTNLLMLPQQWLPDALSIIAVGLKYFPRDVWSFFVGNVSFWLLVHFTWGLIKFVYQKIPVINIR